MALSTQYRETAAFLAYVAAAAAGAAAAATAENVFGTLRFLIGGADE